MKQHKRSYLSRGKGRPSIDDHQQILTFINACLARGATVSSAAHAGLAIISRVTADGSIVLERYLQPATLERRYRESRREDLAEFERLVEPFHRRGAQAIGISVPKPPNWLMPSEPLKRGRPSTLKSSKTKI